MFLILNREIYLRTAFDNSQFLQFTLQPLNSSDSAGSNFIILRPVTVTVCLFIERFRWRQHAQAIYTFYIRIDNSHFCVRGRANTSTPSILDFIDTFRGETCVLSIVSVSSLLTRPFPPSSHLCLHVFFTVVRTNVFTPRIQNSVWNTAFIITHRERFSSHCYYSK